MGGSHSKRLTNKRRGAVRLQWRWSSKPNRNITENKKENYYKNKKGTRPKLSILILNNPY